MHGAWHTAQCGISEILASHHLRGGVPAIDMHKHAGKHWVVAQRLSCSGCWAGSRGSAVHRRTWRAIISQHPPRLPWPGMGALHRAGDGVRAGDPRRRHQHAAGRLRRHVLVGADLVSRLHLLEALHHLVASSPAAGAVCACTTPGQQVRPARAGVGSLRRLQWVQANLSLDHVSEVQVLHGERVAERRACRQEESGRQPRANACALGEHLQASNLGCPGPVRAPRSKRSRRRQCRDRWSCDGFDEQRYNFFAMCLLGDKTPELWPRPAREPEGMRR
jgi:hypothetical protein